ncbi:MAG TPA: 2-oxoglutarate dehydrogenase complex dihydrolipoyllysine-residue succinyltransferase [Dinghuibacter sp.]|uniref:2-oxoglutarate dehydrogenase complex dihydrolipoyllysine-residue succinyltransferase n=1 Tax=Dinghuibacter sp. TaxID=2024697 RepID=UPI002D1D8839|nr:2-oxoglutarate dehydrogenase complex dihydrolipoyllysine-residue succinyltransferase [Dinghuibacter sp.]HTJ12285.1 2-oxoglutarate dehydrogenase complex dihydrolipoyllysine-residue succinyltransferase [Dinghuibacter sp.]
MTDIKVPTVGESISEVTLTKWVKQTGAYVERDEVIAELESEKATFELNAVEAGVLTTRVAEGDTVKVGAVVASIDEKAAAPAAAPAPAPAAVPEVAAAAAPAAPVAAPAAVAAGKGVLDMKVPTVGESISEVTLVRWVAAEGALVRRDEVICELESEKATFELNAEENGKLTRVAKEGDVLKIGEVVAKIDTDVAVPETGTSPAVAAQAKAPSVIPAPAASAAPASKSDAKATPVAAAIMADKKVNAGDVTPTGFQGRITKNDVLEALAHPGKRPGAVPNTRDERKEKMSNLRKTISRRLVEAKNTTAMLTTFNEVDMTRINEVRGKFKDKFKEKHGVGLGLMSFFTKACCFALQEWPAVNAYIDGDSIVYHDYCDISIAVSTPKGLVVPVIRNAESLGMAEIESKVVELATKARDGKLSMEEMTGGTFTITNGGVFGSLMSTPIINPPQSAILGMHKIQDRPMVLNGQVVVRPMMYIALSYDHRVIDGRESVSFLVRVKEFLENPELLLIGKDPVKTLLEI